jgi:hypothetical protein
MFVAAFTSPALYFNLEVTRFQLRQFTVDIKELAEWFGLEVARMVVDECLAPRSGCRD